MPEHTMLHDLRHWVFDPSAWTETGESEWQSPAYSGHPKLTTTRGYYTRSSYRPRCFRHERDRYCSDNGRADRNHLPWRLRTHRLAVQETT